jgi:AraC family transcriptional regulator
MVPRIEVIPEKKLVGKRLQMSFANNRTMELWQSFMPRRKEIRNTLSTDLLNVQVFDTAKPFKDLTPVTEFEKWATQEVSTFDEVPEGMETFILPGGMYAVFLYKGSSSEYAGTFQFIFYQWLPSSEYELDTRPHFEILGPKYKNNHPDSEEEIWIPVKKREINR